MLGWSLELEQTVESLSTRLKCQILEAQNTQDGARQDFRADCDDLLRRATRSFDQALRNRHGEWLSELETAITMVETGAARAMAQMRALLPELVVTSTVVQVAGISAQAVETEII